MAYGPFLSTAVRGRRDILDYRDDEFTRGSRFLLDFKAFGLKYPKSLRIACFVWWGLHFCNDHPAKREGMFERTDIHPCQITVGRDIPRR